MCLAVPGMIVTLSGDDPLLRTAGVAFSGVVKQASLSLLPEARIGDYVLVHAGFAITKLNEEEARRTMQYLRAMSGEELDEELGVDADTAPAAQPRTEAGS